MELFPLHIQLQYTVHIHVISTQSFKNLLLCTYIINTLSMGNITDKFKSIQWKSIACYFNPVTTSSSSSNRYSFYKFQTSFFTRVILILFIRHWNRKKKRMSRKTACLDFLLSASYFIHTTLTDYLFSKATICGKVKSFDTENEIHYVK